LQLVSIQKKYKSRSVLVKGAPAFVAFDKAYLPLLSGCRGRALNLSKIKTEVIVP
jgi:hypothetical protein